VLWPNFSALFPRILKPDLRTSVDFCETRATQPCSQASSAPTVRSIGRVVHRSSARGPHAPRSLCPLTAREGHASPFYAVFGGAWGLRRRTCCWVLLVLARVLHAPPLRRSFAIFPLPASCVWVFLPLCCVFPCFSSTVCLCTT
jgi:hypothetical protein